MGNGESGNGKKAVVVHAKRWSWRQRRREDSCIILVVEPNEKANTLVLSHPRSSWAFQFTQFSNDVSKPFGVLPSQSHDPPSSNPRLPQSLGPRGSPKTPNKFIHT